MNTIREQALACRDAAQVVAALDSTAKRALLRDMAAALEAQTAAVLDANTRDMADAEAKGMQGAMLDRLRLDEARVVSIANALREVAELADPVGVVTRRETRPNGLSVERVRIPLGVIAMIYEARPNVTADAAALCLMAGNGVILRGGSEAIHSNTAIAAALKSALQAHGVPVAALSLVEDLRRETMVELLQLSDIVDLAIPRGGEGLIRFVAEHARVPVIKHYKGVCHLYVDRAADLDLALNLLIDGKTSRPGVCNALETLLVHRDVAEAFLPQAAQALRERGVELRGDERSRTLIPDMQATSDDDYAAEFLDLILAVRVVDNLDDAIAHIRRYGSDHTEVIATADESAAQRFVQAIRSAVVMINASSRFSDGGELGLGAEIGISTTRLHAYGPMGAEALTVERFVVRGEGQVRHPQSRV
ncbi:glutamate-5-semialdehyde dehydrogenase [Rhodanobacter glycinis]|uniref:Gamma-glutamyl phosphate reductase n=1 Tax=Rhodanobacter glycinis TaxID=582702 RepID=A0A502CD05_9GAMM|nr:glutamate-5-semialdehyde dehydrogenase [Rhodanobacter glycinis]TPG10663.1 glutamate-5-semialdehyde dehydrogenase [Rhodanobacter glycinis]TPG51128.1 glutamate-5-semialdehyde dehydrogenase [Rhodanobacter glycinis]